MQMLKILLYIFYIEMVVVITIDSAEDIFSKFHQNDYKVEYLRTDLHWFNQSYYKQIVLKTYKFNRSTAVTNVTVQYKIRVGYDLMSTYQAYKLYSNEYRHFPIRFQIGFCMIAEKNLAGLGRIVKKFNITCPLEKDVVYHFRYYPDTSLLPPFIPNGEYMLEIKTLHLRKDISVLRGYVRIYRPIIIRD